nr:ABC transporter permease subunit [Rhizobium sp. BG4]
MPTTLLLALYSITSALVIAIVTGALAAWRPNSVFDRIATLLSLIGASLPNFWIAIVGVLVFAVGLRLVPTSGTGSNSSKPCLVGRYSSRSPRWFLPNCPVA